MSKEYIDEEAVKRIEKIVQQESIDNATPSEALKCLESIKDALWDDDFHYQRHSKLLDTIEQALLKAQKLEKENAKYKQLEEQIGCPLEVVFKALKQDYIYTKNGKHSRIEFGTYGFEWCICYGLRTQIRVADYKKTWWLKEDKSE